jgi:hypothetical protein
MERMFGAITLTDQRRLSAPQSFPIPWWLAGFARILYRFLKLSIEHLRVTVNTVCQSLLGKWKKVLKGKSLPQQCGQFLSRQISERLVPRCSAPGYQATVPIRLDPRAKNVGDGNVVIGVSHLRTQYRSSAG